jgi:hypothetical protein
VDRAPVRGEPKTPSVAPYQARGRAARKEHAVVRFGLLVREERRLPGGTVIVKYQYGNGPPRFVTHPPQNRNFAIGYAFAR